MRFLLSTLVLLATLATPSLADDVTLTVDTSQSPHAIHERVYGHFLEHIYHSCNGGLWGEVVWNRSFEDFAGGGQWNIQDGVLSQIDRSEDCRIMIGADPWDTDAWQSSPWENYEYSFDAKRTGGNEGFLILFRARHEKIFYWLNVGGWNNQYTQLEKSTLYDGKRAIGPHVDFTVESNRWYHFRCRFEGATFTFWCDDEKILEFTDPDDVITTGIVGLGTWNTTAQFRNIKVTQVGGDQDGSVLYEGLPEDARTVRWRYWENVQGKITPVWEDALNSDVAVRLETIRSETVMGVSYEAARMEQTHVRVRANDPLTGSLFARGKGSLVVGLFSLEGELNTATEVVVDSEDWKEYPIAFSEQKDASDATLILEYLDQDGNHVDIDQVCLMPDSARATGGYRPDLLAAIDALKAPTIRWPGGCFASCYRWKSGIGPQSQRVRHTQSIWEDVDVNSYGTDEFLQMCEKLGVEPILVVNGGSWDKPFTAEKRAMYIREACEWIQYCNASQDTEWGRKRAENGHAEPYNVKLWEMDNETWGMGKEEYCSLLEDLIPAVRATDPSITVLICGSGGLGERNEGQDWNRYLLGRCAHLADYVSIHHYEFDPNNYATGPEAFRKYLETLKGIIAESKNPELEIFVSEWNLQSTDWRTGLYAGGVLNAFESQGDKMTLGGPALFLRHVSATDWDNAFINFDQNGWFAAPNYVVMKLWREHYAPHWLETTGDTNGISISTTKNDTGTVFLKAVNPTDVEKRVRVALNGVSPKTATMSQVTAETLKSRNTLESPKTIHVTPGTATVTENVVTFTLPPLSAAVVEVEN